METNQTDFISTETPRIRKFYEKYSTIDYDTPPLPQLNNFLQLLTSPIDGQTFSKYQHFAIRYQDPITIHLENSNSALKAQRLSEFGHLDLLDSCSKTCETTQKTGIDGLLFDNEKLEQKLNFSNEKLLETIEETLINTQNDLQLINNPDTMLDDQERSLRDITAQINNNSSESFGHDESEQGVKECQDIRKRKRKSNQQLKILQCEFERDGFWGKDKILNVARITGLSESQVYKWCWDQKKKKETDTRPEEIKGHDLKSECSHEKENVSPKGKSIGLHKNSKHIFKTKHASSNDCLFAKSLQKYKLKKPQKLSFESVIPKKIDFSCE